MTLSENGDNTHASLRELALAESREFAHRFVTGDLDWCLSRLAPDFFLVGPMFQVMVTLGVAGMVTYLITTRLLMLRTAVCIWAGMLLV